jgi:hypothetical protein
MFFGSVFAGPGNDLQMRIQATRREHNVKIGGGGGRGGNQPAGPVDLRLAQGRLLGRVSSDDQPVFRGEALALGFGVLQDHKRHRFTPQLPRHAASHATHAADDVVAVETSDFALHFRAPCAAFRRSFAARILAKPDSSIRRPRPVATRLSFSFIE